MPVVRTLIDIQDVVPILTAKGYGINRSHKAHLQLTVQGKRQFSTGAWERELLKPLSKEECTVVLERADNPMHAAILFEKLSLGQITSAAEEVQDATATMGLSAEEIAHIVDSRVQNGINQRMAEVFGEIQSMRAEFANMFAKAKADIEGMLQGQKSAPAKKSKSVKRTDAEVDAAIAAMNIPKLPTETTEA